MIARPITAVAAGALVLAAQPLSAQIQLPPDGSQAGVRYTVRAVPVPAGFTYSSASAINASGAAAGAAGGQSGSQPLVYFRGEVELLEELGGTHDYATSINEAGEVAGVCQSQPWWGSKAVRWNTDGTMTVIYPITGDEHDNAYGLGINNHGHVVGQSDVDGGMWHAFLWTEDTGIIDLDTLGGSYSAAKDINDHGVVVGWAGAPFIWQDSEMTALPSFPGSEIPGGSANAINNHGVIVGESNGEHYGIIRAAMWDAEGNITDLGTLGGIGSRAYDINDAGVIVGESQIETGHHHAFIYTGGVMRDLNDLIPADSGWILEFAEGISEDGRIVGYGRLNGQSRGFVLEPIRPRDIHSITSR